MSGDDLDDNPGDKGECSCLSIFNAFCNFINSKQFCCVGARRALSENNIWHLTSDQSDKGILKIYSELLLFLDKKARGSEVYSFVVFFESMRINSEEEFESFLWTVLQKIHAVDKKHFTWATGYSDKTEDDNFSFSIGGQPFFIVGLHPHAHRISRRFSVPSLVFNHHVMFDNLRKNEVFEKYKRAIRKNEFRIQGTLNKYLSDFGESSEASQYASIMNDSGYARKIKFD